MIADFEKYTWELFVVECDFTNVLATGETITLATSSVTILDSDGADKTTTILVTDSEARSGTKLQAKVQAGTVDTIYTVKFKIITSSNNQFQEDKTLYIKYETS